MQVAELQDHLHHLEEQLLHPDRTTNRAELAQLIADDFQEFCVSGRIMNRAQTLAAMRASSPRPATITYFYVTRLAEDVALATYHATTSNSVSHRSSLWVFRNNRWQLLFHQGTLAA